jgi:hypothetical protein
MRPIDHFISHLDKLALSLQSGGTVGPTLKPDRTMPEGRTLDKLEWDFASLTAPVIGSRSAEDLARRLRKRIQTDPPASLQRIGYIAAFFLGEYDDVSMPLETEDWQEIREAIEDASEEMNIAVLTRLMDELLSRGLLEQR